VNVSWSATRRWLAHTQFFRQTAEALFRARSRRALACFDRLDAPRGQVRSLLGLIHRGHRTPFGREHDFVRIRNVEDFRRLVPLRTSAELRRFPVPPVVPLADATRLSAVTTAIAMAARERPRVRLFDGSFILLGDDVTLPDDPARILPPLVRPFANVRGKVTCLIGSADRLARYLDVCRPDDRVTPAALLYTPSPGITRERLCSRLSQDVTVLELAFRVEAAVSVEDPRYRQHRLLTGHGVFFEFVPAAERNAVNPARLTLDQVETGVVYELVVTAPGGVWACRTETGVCFEQRKPALIRFVPLPTAIAIPLSPIPAILAPSTPAPRPRTSGSPAVLPESYVHTPW
jgi:hypothetical protein